MRRTGENARPLRDDTAIVTGASSGIGAATARELARRGAAVVLAARRVAELEAHVRSIQDEGGRAAAIPTDLADPAQVTRLVHRAVDAFGKVDVLVNAAGASWSRPLAVTSHEDLTRLVGANLLGAIQLTREVIPGMLGRRHGAIVTVGSLAGRASRLLARFAPPIGGNRCLGISGVTREHQDGNDERCGWADAGAGSRGDDYCRPGCSPPSRGGRSANSLHARMAGAADSLLGRRGAS